MCGKIRLYQIVLSRLLLTPLPPSPFPLVKQVACQALYYFLLGPRIPAALYLTEATLDHASHLRFHPTNFINFKQQLFLQVSRFTNIQSIEGGGEAHTLGLQVKTATPASSFLCRLLLPYRFLHAVPIDPRLCIVMLV